MGTYRMSIGGSGIEAGVRCYWSVESESGQMTADQLPIGPLRRLRAVIWNHRVGIDYLSAGLVGSSRVEADCYREPVARDTISVLSHAVPR